MATRSLIGIKKPDKVEYVYCHNDGYLENNGYLLYNYYKDEKKSTKTNGWWGHK